MVGVLTGIMYWLNSITGDQVRIDFIFGPMLILFCAIITANSKSPVDSALKSSVFILISQTFNYLAKLLYSTVIGDLNRSYYYDWHRITDILLAAVLTALSAYIAYYIKKQNTWSVLILSPLIIGLSIRGLYDLSETVGRRSENYSSFISFVFCFLVMFIITLGMLNKKLLRITAFSTIISFAVVYIVFFNGIIPLEATLDPSESGIVLNENSFMPSYTKNYEKITKNEDGKYELKVLGQRNHQYSTHIVTQNIDGIVQTDYYIPYSFDIMGNCSIGSVSTRKYYYNDLANLIK